MRIILFVGLWLIERLFRHLYGLAALILTLYVSVCVSSAYVTNITTLYIVYMLQGGLEGWIQTGQSTTYNICISLFMFMFTYFPKLLSLLYISYLILKNAP